MNVLHFKDTSLNSIMLSKKGGIINVLKVMCIVELFPTTGAVLRCIWTGSRYLELLDWKCIRQLKTPISCESQQKFLIGVQSL